MGKEFAEIRFEANIFLCYNRDSAQTKINKDTEDLEWIEMNEKEVAEIRRRYRPDKNNITHIRGCYVNESREIVSEFNQPLALMQQDEAENILAVLRRVLSGSLGKT